MKRGITVLVSLSALVAVGYFTASKWAIRHETLTFNDPARDDRPVVVDTAVRRDKEMQATAKLRFPWRSSTMGTPSDPLNTLF